jgi:RNA polymerase sigma-70 factor, ECF subfamily
MLDPRRQAATVAAGVTRNVEEADLVACVPHLRAFARYLTGNSANADDLLQETIVRALAAAHRFQAGTNLRAWMFTILRNKHYSNLRDNRVRFLSFDDALGHERSVPPNQEATLAAGDFSRAFSQLGIDWRTALILVGVRGLSYEESGKLCGCPAGTIKSRVSRARSELRRILQHDSLTGRRRDMPALAGWLGDRLDCEGAGSPTAFGPTEPTGPRPRANRAPHVDGARLISITHGRQNDGANRETSPCRLSKPIRRKKVA